MKKRLREVEDIELAYSVSIVNFTSLKSLLELCGPKEWLIETENSVFLLKEGLAFRFCKPSGKPRLLKAKEVLLNPDANRVSVTMDAQDLLAFAVKGNIPVFETPDQYLIPGEITLLAKKDKEVKK